RPLAAAVDFSVFLSQPAPLSWDACVLLRDLVKKFNRLSDDEFLRIKAHHQLANAIRTIANNPIQELAEKASYECSIDLIPYPVVLKTDSKLGKAWPLTMAMVEALIAGDSQQLIKLREAQMTVIEDAWNG